MTTEEKVAYIQSQTACALLEMEAMKVENLQRINQGLSVAYGEDAFMKVISNYGIGHNSVLQLIRG
jgi:hypothetical protein